MREISLFLMLIIGFITTIIGIYLSGSIFLLHFPFGVTDLLANPRFTLGLILFGIGALNLGVMQVLLSVKSQD